MLFRHFIDTFATYTYAQDDREYFKAKCSVRSRSIWGNNLLVLETNEAAIRELDCTFGIHKHGIFLNEI